MNKEQTKRLFHSFEESLPTLQKAIEIHGRDAQKTKAVEELSELITALAKHDLVKMSEFLVIEEIADVLVMALQLVMIFGVDDSIDLYNYKVARLCERLTWTEKSI